MTVPRIAAIHSAYAAVREKTLAAWKGSPLPGDITPLPYHETHLTYTIGSRFDPAPLLEPLIAELEAMALQHPEISFVPRSALHFTFLAVTPHRWEEPEAMPDPAIILNAVNAHLLSLKFQIDNLQILPTANGLLLAGIPTVSVLDARDALLADLRPTEVLAWLIERYGPNFPPVFWHTTLARSRTQFAPQALRDLYFRHPQTNFGTLALPAPRLHIANYNWTRLTPLS